MAEIKKGRLGTSRTTAILKQEGNNAVIYWQSADFPPISRLLFFSIKCLLGNQSVESATSLAVMTRAVRQPNRSYVRLAVGWGICRTQPTSSTTGPSPGHPSCKSGGIAAGVECIQGGISWNYILAISWEIWLSSDHRIQYVSPWLQ